MKLAKIPQLGAQQVSAKPGQAAAGFGAVLVDALKPRAKTAKPADKADKPVAAEKKPQQPATADVIVTQLAHVQALVPHAPVHVPHPAKKHDKPVDAPAPVKAASVEKAAPAELPAPTRDLSAQPAAIFTLPDAPRETAKATPAPPVWLPKEVAADDTARLTVFANTVNFTSEGHALHLQVREGEVSIRARGELAAQLKSSESELRVALAQEGLKLRETEASQSNEDPPEDHRRKERDDEWT